MFEKLIYPFEWLVAWILYGWHSLLTAIGMDPASGLAWVLSIVGLVVVMRAAMIPLFVKQIHSSRRMQLIQPEIKKIQDKYKGKTDPESRQKMTQETMDLYKRTGTNPMSSCMPILVQSPFFFGLLELPQRKATPGRFIECPLVQACCPPHLPVKPGRAQGIHQRGVPAQRQVHVVDRRAARERGRFAPQAQLERQGGQEPSRERMEVAQPG